MRYTRTAITQLTKMYRSVLKKCAFLNAIILAGVALPSTSWADAINVANWADLSEALSGADDINVTANIENANSIAATSSNKTLNVGGNTISGQGSKPAGITVNGGTLTVTGGGTFNNFYRPDTNPAGVDGSEYAVLDVRNGATLGMTGGEWTFSGNTLGIGALNTLNSSISANVDKMVFENNISNSQSAGLRHQDSDNTYTTTTITANEIVFNNNEVKNIGTYGDAKYGGGTAVMNSGGTLELLGNINTFTDNKMNAPIPDGKGYKRGGGAVLNQSHEMSNGTNIDSTMVIGKTDGSSVNTFSGNSSSTNGGAVMNRAVDTDGNATLTINGTTTFSNNSATGNDSGFGGAIYNMQQAEQTATLNLNNGSYTFTSNTANAGGAIYNSGTITLDNTIIGGSEANGNSATGSSSYGGAIYNTGNATISGGSEISYNTAVKGAGGIYTQTGIMTINDSAISHNSATGSTSTGGGLYVNGGTVNITNTNITYNTAVKKGGGIHIADGVTNITGGNINYNSAGAGGAVYNNKKTLNLTDVSFDHNSAEADGGAVYNDRGTVTINAVNSDVLFSNNTANGNANDIYNAGFDATKKATINLNAADGHKITFNGGITSDIEVAEDAAYNVVNITGAGTVEASTIKNQTVAVNGGELHLSTTATTGLNIAGSTVNVASGAIINTIDGVINNYMTAPDEGSGKITLANGAIIKGDIDYVNGVADTYAAADGATVTYILANAITVGAGDAKTIQVASVGSTVNKDTEFFKFTSENGLSLASGGIGTGTVTVTGVAGGINGAVDVTDDGAKTNIDYSVTGNETFDGADNVIANSDFTITGQGTGESDPKITLEKDMIIGDATKPSTLTLNNVKLDGEKTLQNTAGSTLDINNSLVDVLVKNYGTLTSDPTTYKDGIENYLGANATITGDTFSNINRSTENGGAIWNEAGGTLTLNTDTFTGNQAANGGALYNEGTATINGGTFTNNAATANGGAIYSAANLAINATAGEGHVTFTGNTMNNSSEAVANDIYMVGGDAEHKVTLALNAADDTNKITLNGGVDGAFYDMNINAATAGDVALGAVAGVDTITVGGGDVSATTVDANALTLNGGTFTTTGVSTIDTLNTAAGKTFTANADLTVQGGTNAGTINGTGTLYINDGDAEAEATYTNTGLIANAINIAASDKLTTAGVDDTTTPTVGFTGDVANAGTMSVTAGTINSDISGAGALKTADGVAIAADKTVEQGALDVTGTLTNAGTLTVANTLTNGGTINGTGNVTLLGADMTNAGTISGTGTTTIGNGVDAAKLTNSGTITGSDIVISANATLNTAADTVTDKDTSIANAGTLNLSGTTTDGDTTNTASAVTGTGTTNMAGNITVKNDITQKNITVGKDSTGATVAANIVNTDGNTITATAGMTINVGSTVDTAADKLVSGASKYVTNDGTLTLRGTATPEETTTAGMAIKGTGITNVEGNVTIGRKVTQNAVNVSAASQLINNTDLNSATTTVNGELINNSRIVTSGALVNNKIAINNGGSLVNGDEVSGFKATTVIGADIQNDGGTVTNYSHINANSAVTNNAGTLINAATGKISGNVENSATVTNLGTIVGNIVNNANATLTTAANTIATGDGSTISNNGGLTLTSGTLAKAVSGNGTTSITGDVDFADTTTSIGQGIVIANTGNLTADGGNIGGNVAIANGGELDLSGDLVHNITGYNDGVTTTYGSLNVTDDASLTGTAIVDALTVADDITLDADDDVTVNTTLANTGTITGAGDLTLLGAAMSNAGTISAASIIIGNGTDDAALTNAATGLITSDVFVDENAKLTTAGVNDVDDPQTGITGDIDNDGSLELTGGTLVSSIDGAGTLTTTADVTIDEDADVEQGTLVVGNNTTLTSDGGLTVTDTLTNGGEIAGDGSLTLLGANMENAGTISIESVTVGDGTNAAAFENTGLITSDVEIADGSSLETAGVDDVDYPTEGVTGTIANDGALTLTGGTVVGAVTGAGSTEISGDTTLAAAVTQTAGIAVDTGVTLTSDANNIQSAVTNTGAGTLELTGGALNQNVTGGNLDINGDVAIATTADVVSTSATTIEAGKTLTAGDNAVTLGDTTINGTLDVGTNDNVTTGATTVGATGSVEVEITGLADGDDDYDGGQLNVNGNLTTDSDSKLKLDIADGLLEDQHSQSGSLNVVSVTGTGGFTGDQIEVSGDYDVTVNPNGSIVIVNKNSYADVSSAAIGNANNVSAAMGWDNATNLPNGSLARDIQKTLNKISKNNPGAYVNALTNLAPTDSALYQSVALEVSNLINEQVTDRLKSQGMNSGDVFERQGAWVKTFYSHAEQDSDRSTPGFTGKTKGIAFGLDGQVDENTTVGVGYSYNTTDADSLNRDIDITGHNIFAYGKYQPSSWFVRGMVNYGLSDYEEKSHVLGFVKTADYDVKNYGLRTYVGYDLPNGFTPEAGLRYTHLTVENYMDSLGQVVRTDDIDILTATLGVNFQKDVETFGYKWTPKAHFGVTYDLANDGADASVVLGNSAYNISGEALDRFGIEAGVGAEMNMGDWSLSAEYEYGYRDNFENHTGMLQLKYNF